MSDVSRRRFLYAAGATAMGSIVLKGCSGNPPTTGSATSPAAVPAVNSGTGQAPETTSARIGYIPIFESAPLLIAQEKGFFAKHGMSDVQVLKQSSWGSTRDNLVIGAAGGGIDGAQFQMPMPYLIGEGKITTQNQKIPMYVLLQTSTQGNGIAISNKHLGKNIHLDLSKAKGYFEELKAKGTPFTAAYTFPAANQELWIRYWLAAGGINPDTDVKLITVPPAQTVANMTTGTMDGFSTGDPWPYRILAENIGFMAALTAQIWPNHPEEYFAMRADWVDKHPKAAKALIKGVIEAQQWCDKPENRKELAGILAKRQNFNLPVEILSPPLVGDYKMGDGQAEIKDTKMGPLFWKDAVSTVSYPFKSHDTWFLTENVRWGMLPGDTDIKALVDKTNREDLWKEAAKEISIADADIPKETSRGPEKFFDGITFDAANPSEYLKAVKIKKV
ncbi:MAG: ABC transporter substrate-binding protein [Phormidesmis sp. CAN_BIN44]|nr:ABC transporter substrate-binding protein [Phormidesmis sp. CAN_BIN44]